MIKDSQVIKEIEETQTKKFNLFLRVVSSKVFKELKKSNSLVLLDFEKKGVPKEKLSKLKEKMGIQNFDHTVFGEDDENVIFHNANGEEKLPESAKPYHGYKKPMLSGAGFLKFIPFSIKDD